MAQTVTSFKRTKAAIQRYERFRLRWEREFERNLNSDNGYLDRRATKYGVDVNAFVLGYFSYMVTIQRRIVGEAFAADTAEFNNKTTVLECLFPLTSIMSEVHPFVRRMAA